MVYCRTVTVCNGDLVPHGEQQRVRGVNIPLKRLYQRRLTHLCINTTAVAFTYQDTVDSIYSTPFISNRMRKEGGHTIARTTELQCSRL